MHESVETRVKNESKYQRAAALWIAERVRKDANRIYGVTFTTYYGGYCETCGYETTGLEYYFNGTLEEFEFGSYRDAGEFIQECMELLEANNVG